MSSLVDVDAVVVVPNWNGIEDLPECLDSLLLQSLKPHIIVVDNGSIDGSVELIKDKYPGVELIRHDKNYGYAGGVNPGLRRAIEAKARYVAPFNNDAVADKDWLKNLVAYLDAHEEFGIAACKLLSEGGHRIDSTGDYYTNWGLPYPRGRGENASNRYDKDVEIFGASGGASLFRVSMLQEIGLFDEDFFAYYEDVDLSFRAQLAGYKVAYVPEAIAYHKISATSSRIKGFATYQTLKNLPMLMYKNVPGKYLYRVAWRFWLAHILFFGRAITRGHGWYALKGLGRSFLLARKTHKKRQTVQASKKASDDYIWGIIVHDLPPNAFALRSLRSRWWAVRGRQ